MNWKMPMASLIACGVLATGGALAADSEHTTINLDQAKWGPVPPSLPPGAEIAVLSGNPGKRGYFAVAVRGPQGYTVPPHWHSSDEHVTVISGSFTMGAGDAIDASAGAALTAGGYAMMPRHIHHWATAGAPFVVEIQAVGPFDFHYVSPADDPRKPAKK